MTEFLNDKRVLNPNNVAPLKLKTVPVVKRKRTRKAPLRAPSSKIKATPITDAYRRYLESAKDLTPQEAEKITLKANTFEQASVEDSPLQTCDVVNERFDTKPCTFYLRECNLCGALSFCEHHGCQECNLKAKDSTQALIAVPDEERSMMQVIAQRRASYKPAKKITRRKKARLTDIYDDILAANKAE